MTGFDWLLRGGHVVLENAVIDADIAIVGDRIAAVGRDLGGPSERILDVSGRYLFPGGIDPHTHVAYGQKPFDENARRESISMAVGGITTAFSFVGRREPYSQHLPQLIDVLSANTIIDMGFHPILGRPEQTAEIPALARDHGAVSFKFYPATQAQEIYPEVYGIDDGLFYQALREIAHLGSPATALVHAENWEVHYRLREELIRDGRTDQAAWTESRPRICEEDGVRRTLLFADRLRCPTYIVHVSTREGAHLIGAAKRSGTLVIGETCPHYLCLTKDDRLEVLGRINPPLRDRTDNEALWQALARGEIECIGSDHIPNRSKSMATDNIFTTRVGGFPGSGIILPVLWSEGVRRGRIDAPTMARVSSTNAARWFGLYPRKGSLTVGADADIVVWDPEREVDYTPEWGHLSSDFSWFTGWKFHGWPSHVFRRGELIVEGNEVLASPGSGRYVRRSLASAAPGPSR